MSPSQIVKNRIFVRETRHSDFDDIIQICKRVYPNALPWATKQLESHMEVFPQGQLVAYDPDIGRVVGMSASLVINWDDYEVNQNWRDFTDHGWFTNHDPETGRTLYGAEVMVDPLMQRRGIGAKLYAGRRRLVQSEGLWRIRAGSRLRGYGKVADKMNPEEYVRSVALGEFKDPTLSFQLKHGFCVIGIVSNYLRNDPASRGYAAIIEWLNNDIAKEAQQ